MANPQADKFLRISTELFDQLCKIRISGEARQIFDYIIRKTWGYNKKEDQISYSQFEQGTNLPSRSIRRSIQYLINRNMITSRNIAQGKEGIYSIQKDYSKWIELRAILSPTSRNFGQKLRAKVRNTINNTIDNTINNKNSKQPPSALLSSICDEVYKLGFNVYMMINKFKKESKLNIEVPEEVIINVCISYKQNKDTIKNQYAWFIKALTEESRSYFAKKNEEEGKQYKKEPTQIGDIMKLAMSKKE